MAKKKKLISKISKSIKSQTKKTLKLVSAGKNTGYQAIKKSFGKGRQQKAVKYLDDAYSKVKVLADETSGRIEAVLVSQEFEEALDKLISFKNKEPEARSVGESHEEALARIKRKLLLSLKLYRTELGMLIGWMRLPGKLSKLFPYVLIAYEFLNIRKKTSAEENSSTAGD